MLSTSTDTSEHILKHLGGLDEIARSEVFFFQTMNSTILGTSL